jgi:hypothetical protein
LTPEDGFFGIEAQSDIIHRDIESVAGNVIGRRIARKSMIVGYEIKTFVLCLELQVLTHGTEKVPYMKSAGRLYARKYSQANLLIPKAEKS